MPLYPSIEILRELSKKSAHDVFNKNMEDRREARLILKNVIQKILEKFPKNLDKMNEEKRIFLEDRIMLDSPPSERQFNLLLQINEYNPIDINIGYHNINFVFQKCTSWVEYTITLNTNILSNQYTDKTFDEKIDPDIQYLIDSKQLSVEDYYKLDFAEFEKFRELGKKTQLIDKLHNLRYTYLRRDPHLYYSVSQLQDRYEKQIESCKKRKIRALEEIQQLALNGSIDSMSVIDYDGMVLFELQDIIEQARKKKRDAAFEREC